MSETPPTLEGIASQLDNLSTTVHTLSTRVLEMHQATMLPMRRRVALTLGGAAIGGAMAFSAFAAVAFAMMH